MTMSLVTKKPDTPLFLKRKIVMTTRATLTHASVEATIEAEYYFTAADGLLGAASERAKESDNTTFAYPCPAELGLLTFCVLVLKNGFKVVGHSCCIKNEIYDKSLGENIARENAVSKIWELEGYLLKEQTYQAP